MINKIALYIAISVVVSIGIGYGTGHYVASSKAERDIAAIRAILEKQEIEKENEKAEREKRIEEYLKETKARTEREKKTPSKSY